MRPTLAALSSMSRALLGGLLLAAASTGAGGTAQAQQASTVDWVVNLNDTGSDPVAAGGLISYTLTIANGGEMTAPASTTTLTIPEDSVLESVMGVSGCDALPTSGPTTVTCALPPIAADDSLTAIFGLRTQASGTLSFSASVPTSGDAEPDNNAATEITTVAAGANLTLTAMGPQTIVSGGQASYTFAVKNLGPDATDGAEIHVPTPQGLANITPPDGCFVEAGTYHCPVPYTLEVGGTHSVVFSAQVSAGAGSDVAYTASVDSGNPSDPIGADNTAVAHASVLPGSDLFITVQGTPASPRVVGDQVVFTLSPRYTGDVPEGLTATYTLPNLYTFQSATGTGWACAAAGQAITCTRPAGSVAGTSVALPDIAITATAAQAGTAAGMAEIRAQTIDPNPDNNTGTDGEGVVLHPTIDLRANTTSPQTGLVVVGNTYTFRLSTTNIGTTGFSGTIVMEEQLPKGYTITDATTNGWTCATPLPLVGPASYTCTLAYTPQAPLAPGASAPRVYITAEATQDGTVSNTLIVSAQDSNLPDTNPANNTSTITTGGSHAPQSADLSLTRTALRPTLAVGDVQTFRVEIANTGPATAHQVTLVDNFHHLLTATQGATGAGYVGHTYTPGLASGAQCAATPVRGEGPSMSLSCTIDTLPVCEPGVSCPVFDISVRFGGEGGARTDTSEAYSHTVADPTHANNEAVASYSLDARADLAVSTVTPNASVAGQPFTYTLTARNTDSGMSTAEAVRLTDTLPTGAIFVSARASQGTCTTTATPGAPITDGDTATCEMGNIASGAQRTVSITVQPQTASRGTAITNTATLTSATTDPDPANNTSTTTKTVQNPVLDLLINTVDSVDPVAIDDATIYTIRVHNNGPSSAENVRVHDALPKNRLFFTSHTIDSDGACTTLPAAGTMGGTMDCAWPTLPAGGTRTLTITLQGESKGVALNTAHVSSDETAAGFETNPANNTSTQTTTVRTRADMEVVSKVASLDRTNLRDAFTYTILVRNNPGHRRSEADEVEVKDTLPAGMEIAGAVTPAVVAGTASSLDCTTQAAAFSCDLGTVSSGGAVEIVVPVRLSVVSSYPQTFTNTATVTTSSLDVVPSNDSASGSVTIDSSSISGRLYYDFNNDGAMATVDAGIPAITMALSGTAFDGTAITRTTTTATDGTYAFSYIPHGTYTITRGALNAAHINPGATTPGTAGGTAQEDLRINDIVLAPNTAATGYRFSQVPVARIGVSKFERGMTVRADGSVTSQVRIPMENLGIEPLSDITVTEALDSSVGGSFGTYKKLANPVEDPLNPGEYTIYSQWDTCGRFTSSTFNGASDTTLLSGMSKDGGAGCRVDYVLRWQPQAPLTHTTTSPWEVQSTITANGVWSGQTPDTNPQLRDVSHDSNRVDRNGNGIGNEPSENGPLYLNPKFTPALALVKTVALSGITTPIASGNTLTYTFTVHNTGNIALTDVVITDPMLEGAVGEPIDRIMPGAHATRTATYTLTQADIDARRVSNQATVQGTHTITQGGERLTVSDTSGTDATNNLPTVVNLGDISLVQKADTSGLRTPPQAGDIVRYTYEVHNLGHTTLTNAAITSTTPGLAITGGPLSLAAGGVDTNSFTATYALTQADIDRGHITASAQVSAVYAAGNGGATIAVSDTGGSATTNDTPIQTFLAQAPQVRLVKQANVEYPDSSSVGDTITYAFTVHNTGNTTLTTLALEDNLPGITLTAPALTSLAPGATHAEWTGTYTITQADIDRGHVDNQAMVTGSYTTPTGTMAQVSDASGTTTDNNTPTRAFVPQAPAIRIVKIADTSGLSQPAAVGDTLAYTFTARNTGNTTLFNVQLVDDQPGMVLNAPALTSLNSGTTHTGWTGTYTITQSDIDRGFVQNSATVTGGYTDSSGGAQKVQDVSGPTPTTNTPTRTDLVQGPGLALIKAVDAQGLSTPPADGDTLAYAFTLTNTGNTTLTDIALSDGLLGIVLDAPAITSLAPGATDTTWTASYTLTQADIDRGFVENTATATGAYTDATGATLQATDASGTTGENDTPTHQPLAQEPALALIHTADTSGIGATPMPGDTIAYAFTITNTGNTTLTGLDLSAALPGITSNAPTIAAMAPGATDTTWTASYALTQADIDRGFVESYASTSATYTHATEGAQGITDVAGNTTTDDTPIRTPLHQKATLALTASANTAALSTPPRAGQSIDYTFTITNTGNTTLADADLVHALDQSPLGVATIPTLAPGASDATWATSYTLTQADIDRGFVQMSALAIGTYTDANTTTQDSRDLSGTTAADDTPTRTSLAQNGALALTKAVSGTSFSTPPSVGDTISYAFTLTNTGNVSLSNMRLEDALAGITLDAEPVATLAPDASTTTWTASYTLTQADIDRGYVDNTATAFGAYQQEDGAEIAVSDTSGTTADNDTPTRQPVAQTPRLALVQTANTSALSNPPVPGERVSYTLTLTNTGTTTLTDIVLTDSSLGLEANAPTIAALEPGASDASWTATYALTQDDIDRGFVEHASTAAGQYSDADASVHSVVDISGTDRTNDTPTRTPLAQSAGLALTAAADTSALSTPPVAGDTITYTLALTNTGNTTLAGITLAGGDTATAPTIATLEPGMSDTTSWSNTYVLTQADIDRGFVTYSTSATGSYTGPDNTTHPVADTSGTAADNNTPVRVDNLQAPGLALVKTVDDAALSTPAVAGDVLAYHFTLRNTGNTTLTDLTLTDSLPGIVLDAPSIATLAPGAEDNSWAATYAITQADINQGIVENTAQASATHTDAEGAQKTVQAMSGTASDNTDPTIQTLVQSGGLALVGAVDASALSTPPTVGDTLAYTFTATNTGNTTLSGITLAHLPAGFTASPATIAPLAPGASGAPWSATYTLSQDDIDRGFVEHAATASGTYTPANGADVSVSDISGTEASNDTPNRTDLAQAAGLALVMHATKPTPSTPAQVGDIVAYTLVLHNTGNTTLTDAAITGAPAGLVLNTPTIPEITTGTATDAWSAIYTLTQADIDRGFVEHSVSATASYTHPSTGAQDVEDISGTDTNNNAPTRTTLIQEPGLALVKTVDTHGLSTPPAVGDTLAYSFALTNTGNTTLVEIALADALDGLVLNAPTIPTLAPGATNATWTATYTLAQGDIDQGFVENTAVATATSFDATGMAQTVRDTSTRADLGQTGAITLVQQVNTTGLSSPAAVGDVLTYSFTVTNAGNTTLSGVAMQDALAGIVLDAPRLETLLPGQEHSGWSATYAITQADIDKGYVENTATALGTWTDAAMQDHTVRDISGDTAGTDMPTRVTLAQTPALALVMRAAPESEKGITRVGDTIRYTYAIHNTGNTTLTNVALTQTLAGAILDGGPIARMEPGAVDTGTYSALYAVTAEDFIAGRVDNQAAATAIYTNAAGQSHQVSASSGTDLDNTQPTTLEMGEPGIALDITIANTLDRNESGHTDPGDGVRFRFTATNTGALALTEVGIVYQSLSLDMPDLSCATITLDAGEAALLECTGDVYTITTTDAAAGTLALRGEATGISPSGAVIGAASITNAVTVEPMAPEQTPQLLAEKSAQRQEVRVGENLEWTITITHPDATGAAVLVAVVDALPQGFALREGSARLNGQAVALRQEGRTVIFPSSTIAPGGTLRATLTTTVLSTAQPGTHTNHAWAHTKQGAKITNTAEAMVRVTADPVFGCSTVVGRVFDDANANGIFDGEQGLGGVRLITPDGIAITTDPQGRFHVPCAALPASLGQNFQLKVDERSLPAGHRIRTENPRVVRVTAGMITRMDFGTAAPKAIDIALNARAFPQEQPRAELAHALTTLAQNLQSDPATVRLIYHLSPGESPNDAQRPLTLARRLLREAWRDPQVLRVETLLAR